ncbi:MULTISPECIES: tripartite tricarboxylate transporter TctB family protein [unclassified Paenibacillus]|uniref:tripartite tricarboxylate transporter TctB family protein n=1 Tax=unclassified Paenibacillus TaxID=185978 RepID=UPI0006CF2684|nr:MULTISPECIES: tripartite tricarboxylate transporter TctB family protein [unclassified Paenibacillus]
MLKNAGFVVGIVILLFASLILWQSLSLDYYSELGPGPGLLPLWLSAVLMVLSLLFMMKSLKKSIILFPEILPRGRGLGNILTIIAAVLFFIIAAPFAGFTIAGILTLSIILIRDYKWVMALGVSATVTVSLFYVFKFLLNVPLPVNTLGF